jgi:hypothetical protein
MRCKKCGFISFDFNQVCPKCNRGLSDEQRTLNLPAFRPEPPMLLGRLLGESYEDADVNVIPDKPAVMQVRELKGSRGFDDSMSVVLDDDVSFEDEEELDVVSLVEAPRSGAGYEGDDIEPILDLEDISPEESEEDSSPRMQDEEDMDLVLEGDDLILEESMIESSGDMSPGMKGIDTGKKEGMDEEGISFKLEDLSFEDLDLEDGEPSETGSGPQDKHSDVDNVPVAEFDIFKDSGTMEAFYLDSNAEGLTKEIDMKKFRKDLIKDKKPQ